MKYEVTVSLRAQVEAESAQKALDTVERVARSGFSNYNMASRTVGLMAKEVDE